MCTLALSHAVLPRNLRVPMREFHGRLRKEETNDLGSATFQIWLRSGTHYSIDGFTIDHTATTLLPFPRPPPSCPHNLIFAMSTIRKHNEFTNPPNYSFPSHRLSSTLRDSAKQPLVLVACGSFSPVTYLHLRMFEMAKDYIRQNTDFEIVGGYLSPVSDMYKKPGLLSAQHR